MAVTTRGESRHSSSNGASPPELQSHNPATGELLGAVPTITPDQVQEVVDDVAKVQPVWAQLSLNDRARYLRRAAQVLLDQSDDVAELLTREQGKPRLESFTMELVPTIDLLHWCANNGPRILADERVAYPQLILKQKKSKFVYEPIGVVGVIAPWNYPWTIPFGEVAIAVMAGNGVVLKPASLTPLIGQKIQEIFERAGFPEGLIRVVHGGGAVGQALVESTAGKIFFTGSVEVGRGVGEECARRMKGSVLELGGKDPQIVCSDANLSNAISGAVWGGFANAGQTCSGIERTYVMRDVADRFIDGVVREASALPVGDPLQWTTAIGPMVSKEQYDLVCELVDDALASGAKRLCGGPREVPGLSGHFIAPTVLTGVTPEAPVMAEEIFGPILPVLTYKKLDEVPAFVTARDKPLALYVFGRDQAAIDSIVDRTTAGGTCINNALIHFANPHLPFGGVGPSGTGNYHGLYGFKAFSHERAVLKQGALDLTRTLHPPYGPKVQRMIRWMIKLFA